jgi:predicted secreted hydrolase
MKKIISILITLLLLLFVIILLPDNEEKIKVSSSSISVAEAMGGSIDSAYSRADEVIDFNFPEDHEDHPTFRTEWWYFTGNLSSSNSGREFGYQFTIFRNALSSDTSTRKSDWAANQHYMAHFTVTDVNNKKFYFEEKNARAGNGLAGIEKDPLKVWLYNWEIRADSDNKYYQLPKLHLKADAENHGIDLNVKAVKPFILQGDSGLSQKGEEIGNASYYYSYTRLATHGTISIGGKEYEVTGDSWLDREWSTSALGEDQVGWDWFSLQLNNNVEIMYYQIRNNDGEASRFSKGVVVDSLGNKKNLSGKEVSLKVNDYWESPTGSRYPSGWKIKLPSENIELSVEPKVNNQELVVSVKYWEGAVDIKGTYKSESIKGSGYVELTGY